MRILGVARLNLTLRGYRATKGGHEGDGDVKNTINGQRREDRARRTIVVGALAAVTPIVAPMITARAGSEMPNVLVVSTVSTVAAAVAVGLLIVRLTGRLEHELNRFDDERRHWRDEANTDPLCRIPNRRGAYEQVETLRREADADAHWTLLALDVDRFKEVNDRHGHAVGDRVLATVANVLTEQLPEGASVARWGGDEFVVFMLGHRDLPVGWAESFSDAVKARPVHCREGQLHVGISFGLAQGPASNRFDDVLAVADEALLRAKDAMREPIRLDGHVAAERPTGTQSVVTVATRPRNQPALGARSARAVTPSSVV